MLQLNNCSTKHNRIEQAFLPAETLGAVGLGEGKFLRTYICTCHLGQICGRNYQCMVFGGYLENWMVTLEK